MPELASALPELASALPELASALPELASALPELASALPEATSALPKLAWTKWIIYSGLQWLLKIIHNQECAKILTLIDNR